MDFWSVNPYVGCEFGCNLLLRRETRSAYAVERETSRADAGGADTPLMGLGTPAAGWLAFERRSVKRGAGATLARSASIRPGSRAPRSPIGTATDPYQPAERRFRITREILEALTAYRGLSIGVVTKSPLVVRDIELLPGG